MSVIRRRALWRGAVGGIAMLAFAAPVGASAKSVPLAATLKASLVSAAPKPATAALSLPVRVQDPARYAREKAAAERAYGAWSVAHSSVFGPGLPTQTAIPALNKPGLSAAGAGGSTPPDTTGAIGPASYLEMVNSEIAVYSRSTLASPPISTAPEDTFVGSSSTCDGQIKWDNAAARFEYYSLDCAAAPGGEGFSFGWSKTSSPTPLTGASANWCRFHVPPGAASRITASSATTTAS